LNAFSYARPRALADALRMLRSGAVALAGGTDLVGLMKDGLARPQSLVDLTGIEGLRGWSHAKGRGLRIGALTPLVELETSDALAKTMPILRESLRDAARIEAGLRAFLEDGSFRAFTDTFEDLDGLTQLPGLAVQRLMADGYGFGGEGDWKTSALLRVLKVMSVGFLSPGDKPLVWRASSSSNIGARGLPPGPGPGSGPGVPAGPASRWRSTATGR